MKRRPQCPSLQIVLAVAAVSALAESGLAQQPAASVDALGGVVITRNVDYVAGSDYANDKDKLDLFMPEGIDDAPVLVFFHGGALTAGNKSAGEALATRFVPQGVGIVSANYRLSPGVMHPAHTQDAAAAFAWVVENIERYGGDPERVFVSGHSAGAYLAALVALDPSYLAAHGLGLEAVRGAIPISAFLFVEETARDRIKTVWGEDPAAWLSASVTPHIVPGRPPMLLIYADGDDAWRRGQNEKFGEAMHAAGNHDIRIVQVPDRNHTSLMSRMNASDDQIRDLVLSFIQR